MKVKAIENKERFYIPIKIEITFSTPEEAIGLARKIGNMTREEAGFPNSDLYVTIRDELIKQKIIKEDDYLTEE